MSALTPALVLPGSLVSAALAGFLLHRYGGRAGKPWAVPVAAAAALGGVGWSLGLPSWVMAAAFLAVTFFANRPAKKRQLKAAKELDFVDLAPGRPQLGRHCDPSGRFLAVWKDAPSMEAPKGPPGPEVGLEFAGETDDEFRVIVSSRAQKFRPGVAVAHHAQAQGEPLSLLPGTEPVSGLPGQAGDLVIRTLPPDLAFAFFDGHSLALIRDALELRTGERELHFHLDGPGVRFVSDGVFSSSELRVLIAAARELAEHAEFLGKEGE